MSATQLTKSDWIRSLLCAPEHDQAVVVEPLHPEDLARVLTTFRGQPVRTTTPMRYERTSTDGDASAYVLDQEAAMVYILD